MRPANPEDLPRPRRALLSVAVALSFYSTLSFAAELRCDAWAAQLVSMEGSVSWRPSEAADWQSARLHDYFCQGDLLRVEQSRAALRLNNETIVRLSEHSQLKLLPQTQSFWVELKQGAAHFLSRTPRDFTVNAPYVNASVDGTEFLVAHQAERDTVTVLEGRVTASNAHGEVSLAPFEQAYAAPGSAPQKRLEIQLRDAVSWTLHYPQLSSLQRGAPDEIARLVAGGEIDAARARLEALPALAESAPLQNLLTSLNLYSGRVAAARAANERALEFDPNSPDALALRAMMTLAEGERDQAARQARELTERFADNASVWLVHSYVLQAQFELEAAYRATDRALRIAPTDSALWLRRAELALNLDRTRDTHRALAEAGRLAPGNLDAELLRGILELKQRHFDRARQRFAAVVEADSGHALGQFMLGLADIRLGQLQAGRERLELAALLDPNNSLYRSYLGKAYFEEHRLPLADTQYDLAKTLDPNDPTPYFYSALQQQYLNRPHLAFEQIELAVAKNDNRALFRSRLQLDADEAARVASQAEIYRDIGLEERAQFLAGQAIAAAPGAHSGHRMMAESLIDDPLADAARASEILQAQLTQPLSKNTFRSFLSGQSRFAVEGLGPERMSAGEFNALFDRPSAGLELAMTEGANNTRLRDIHGSAMSGRNAINAGWHEYQTSGFTDNNHIDYSAGSFYFMRSLSDPLKFHLEIKSSNEDIGDLYPLQADGNGADSIFQMTETDSYRASVTYQAPRNTYILTTFATKQKEQFIQNMTFEGAIPFTTDDTAKDKVIGAQAQTIATRENFHVIGGASYSTIDRDERSLWTYNNVAEEPYISESEIKDTELYGYAYFDPTSSFSLMLGGTQYWHDETEGFDPKLAIHYSPNESISITAAAFENIKRRLEIEQSLEPTNLFGIVQQLDETSLAKSKNFAVALDVKHRNHIFSGVQIMARQAESPTNAGEIHETEELNLDAYALFTRGSASIKLAYKGRYMKHRNHEDIAIVILPWKNRLLELPIELRYFFSSGANVRLDAIYYNYEIQPSERDSNKISDEHTSINLWLEHDQVLGNRLRLSMHAALLNLADDKTDLQYVGNRLDPTPKLWHVIPERYGVLGFSLKF